MYRRGGEKLHDVSNWFEPCPVKDCSVDASSIVSTTQRPPWITSDPASEVGQFADIMLRRICESRDAWDHAPNTWLCSCFLVDGLVVQESGSSSWILPIAIAFGVLGIGWPMQRCPDTQSLSPMIQEGSACPFEWLFCYDLSKWKCKLGNFCRPGTSRVKGAIVFKEESAEVLPLLHGLAKLCFGSLPKQPLEHLAKHLGYDITDCKTIFDILRVLISNVLDLQIDSEEMLDILEKRNIEIPNYELLQNLIDESEGVELHKFDEESFEKSKKEMSERKNEQHEYKTQLGKLRKQVRDDKLNNKKLKGPERQRLQKPLGKWRPPVKACISSDLTIAQLRDMIPPEFQANIHKHQARWEIFCPKLDFYCSRSWGKYGFRESAMNACREAWLIFMERNCITECPIPGLFPKRGAGSSTD